MSVLVVYESMYGNTQRIAESVADGLSTRTTVDLLEVGSAPPHLSESTSLLVVGGPTHALTMSRASTRKDALGRRDHLVSSGPGIREWISGLGHCEGVPAATFDTAMAGTWIHGSAARSAARQLRRRGLEMIYEPQTFRVQGMSGPLAEGEYTRAYTWGHQLALRFALLP